MLNDVVDFVYWIDESVTVDEEFKQQLKHHAYQFITSQEWCAS